MDLTWFAGIKFVTKQYHTNTDYIVFGRPTVFNGRIDIIHPDIDPASELMLSKMGLQPYYSTTEKMKKMGLTSRTIERLTQNMLERLTQPITETLPQFITDHLHLVTRDAAMRNVHYPKNADELKRARLRLKFEELFYIQLNILRYAADHRRKYRGYVFLLKHKNG